MKLNDAFPSKYLTADDVDPPKDFTIRVVLVEEVGREDEDKEKKPIVYFKETDKGIVLNKTNFAMIEELTGEPDTDFWADKKINLYRAKTMFGGKSVPCIRVRACNAITGGVSPLLKKQVKEAQAAAGLSDEAVVFFLKQEMLIESQQIMNEKSWTDLLECIKVGYVAQVWNDKASADHAAAEARA